MSQRTMGFTYNGVHCSELGLTYIPDKKGKMYDTPDYSMIEEQVTGKPGSYFYGNKVAKNEFSLLCFFEDLPRMQFEEVMRWVDRKTSGQLIFDERPYVYYNVRPSKKPSGEVFYHEIGITGVYSGTITFTFTAHDPFGYMTETYYDDDTKSDAIIGTGIMPSTCEPTLKKTAGTSLVYNPGTEFVETVIKLAGSAPNGLTIMNYTTGDVCTFTSLPPGKTLVVDSNIGKITTESDGAFAYSYHDDGYITLAPCIPYRRNIIITHTKNSNVITSEAQFQKDDVGKYTYVAGGWHKILQVTDESNATVDAPLSANKGTETTIIAVMNEINVSGAGFTLSKFEIDFIPRVR